MREGLIPTILGTGVTAAGIALRGMGDRRTEMKEQNMLPTLAAGIIGFGLAHVVLGTIDLIADRR